jgi:hypothetical protein
LPVPAIDDKQIASRYFSTTAVIVNNLKARDWRDAACSDVCLGVGFKVVDKLEGDLSGV